MRTHRKDVFAARATDSLRLAVTLAASLALSAGIAGAESANSTHPASASPANVNATVHPNPNASGVAMTAKPGASTTTTPSAKPAANAVAAQSPATNAMALPKSGAVGVSNAPNATVANKSSMVSSRPLSPALPAGAGNAHTMAASSNPKLAASSPLPAPNAKSMSGVSATTPKVATPAAELDEHVTYQYNTLGRRDPFQSMISGDFVGQDVGGDAPPDVGGLKVVGIVWGDTDRFALVEDGRGNSSVLRRGDKVMNGVVEDLKQDGVVVNLTVDGQSQSVMIPLTRKGDKANGNR